MGQRGNTSFRKKQKAKKSSSDGLIRLNKYIAKAGICSRREADTFIEAGVVKVNGEVITEMGYKVSPTDDVRFNDSRLKTQTERYLLLNKPKNYSGRKENSPQKKDVFQLIKGACKESILPTCRLAKNATGLLLFTNDSLMAKKLSNPKKRVKEIFHLHLDKKLSAADLNKIQKGLTINGRKIIPNRISYIENKDKNEVGIELNSRGVKGVNIIFEQLGYKVSLIDRVFYAGLTKKDLPRKKYRFLTTDEINVLKRI
jgi:23S rRNA pseudouridine2605 synthase